MTYEEFVLFYNTHGRTPNQLSSPKNSLNEKQLKSLYNKYCMQEEKKQKKFEDKLKEEFEKEKEIIIDEKWEALKKEVYERDNNKCQLIPKLKAGEFIEFIENAGWLKETIDPAHIFGKGVYPQLKYDPDNVCLLNRYSHSMLDTYKNPVNGKPITQEEHVQWWIRIVSGKRYLRLEEKTKE